MKVLNESLRKIQLVSNNVCYGPCPETGEVVEQHLTITADGRVWLSQYCFNGSVSGLGLKEKTCFKVSPQKAAAVFDAVSECFDAIGEFPFVTDVGSWELVLTYADGFAIKYSGPLLDDKRIIGAGLSDVIRSRLGRSDLFVFDGGPADETNTSC